MGNFILNTLNTAAAVQNMQNSQLILDEMAQVRQTEANIRSFSLSLLEIRDLLASQSEPGLLYWKATHLQRMIEQNIWSPSLLAENPELYGIYTQILPKLTETISSCAQRIGNDGTLSIRLTQLANSYQVVAPFRDALHEYYGGILTRHEEAMDKMLKEKYSVPEREGGAGGCLLFGISGVVAFFWLYHLLGKNEVRASTTFIIPAILFAVGFTYYCIVDHIAKRRRRVAIDKLPTDVRDKMHKLESDLDSLREIVYAVCVQKEENLSEEEKKAQKERTKKYLSTVRNLLGDESKLDAVAGYCSFNYKSMQIVNKPLGLDRCVEIWAKIQVLKDDAGAMGLEPVT